VLSFSTEPLLVGPEAREGGEELALESPRRKPAYFVARMIKDWAVPYKNAPTDFAQTSLMPR
jgi:hypothetical protein